MEGPTNPARNSRLQRLLRNVLLTASILKDIFSRLRHRGAGFDEVVLPPRQSAKYINNHEVGVSIDYEKKLHDAFILMFVVKRAISIYTQSA
jgi:hypothetical protein